MLGSRSIKERRLASPEARSSCPFAVGCALSQKRYEPGSLQMDLGAVLLVLVDGGAVTRQEVVTLVRL